MIDDTDNKVINVYKLFKKAMRKLLNLEKKNQRLIFNR